MRSMIRWGHDPELPFTSLQRDINRLFDSFFPGQELSKGTEAWEQPLTHYHPKIDVMETDREVRVQAELPGMEEKDVEVLLSNDTLTLKGEKKAEVEEKGKTYYRLERSYGTFHRTIELPAEVQADKVEASFKKGVLTVTLPKSERAREEIRKIAVRKE
jgi:HSP20 family protein